MAGNFLTRKCLRACGRLLALALALQPLAVGAGRADATAPAQGTVSGCVDIAGHGPYRGVASLWPARQGKAPDPRRAIRPPLVSRPLGTDGCFTLQAPPGEYFVGAVVRLSEGGWQGPPRPGDRVFLSPDAADGQLTVTLPPGATIDIGRHAAGWTYAGFTSPAPAMAIAGTLTGNDGQPLAGLLVFAFLDSTMSKDPLAVSEPSDGNGRYLLRLPEPATVYLRAREHYGRRNPMDGGYMGVYGGSAPQAVHVGPTGDDQPRDFTVFLIPARRDAPQPAPTFSPPVQKN